MIPSRQSCSLLQRCRSWLILGFAVLLLTVCATPLQAQEGLPAGNPIDGYPVGLEDKVLFNVKQGVPGTATAEERAKVINERLMMIANDTAISPDSIRIEEQGNTSLIMAGNTILITLWNTDQEIGESRQQLAEKAVQLLKPSIVEYRANRSAKQIAKGIIRAVVSTILLIGFLLLLQRLVFRLLLKIRAARRADALEVRIRNLQLLGSDASSYLLAGLLQLLKLILVITALYIYIPFLLSQFPATAAIGNSIFRITARQGNELIASFVQYLPNLLIIALIALLTYYMTQFAGLVITEMGRDNAYPWFYPEWIQPTQRLVALLLIAIACVVAAPYLPGFGSPAFQGVSLFLGALLTLGSSSAVANTISGIILIYTRAFRIGDMVQIGDIMGEVIEKSLFVTRVLTPKQEVITIPNLSVLNGNVINYSTASRDRHPLILHTTITLGYDIPWRKVHQVLIEAAKATEGIVAEPAPFVLQTALNDYNISYELNAYTNQPKRMPVVYSELHQNIQDFCNQASIEILSPAFSALRDGNHSTIPADYLPSDYHAPGFQIQNQNNR